MNISTLTKVREIGSVTSGQARSKDRRSALESTPKFPKDNQVRHKEESNALSSSSEETENQEDKDRLYDAIEAFKASPLDLKSFLKVTPL